MAIKQVIVLVPSCLQASLSYSTRRFVRLAKSPAGKNVIAFEEKSLLKRNVNTKGIKISFKKTKLM